MRWCRTCRVWRPAVDFWQRAKVCVGCLERRVALRRRFEAAGLPVHYVKYPGGRR